MSIKIYFEIPPAKRGQRIDVFIDGEQISGLGTVLFRNKRMLNYNLTKHSAAKIRMNIYMDNGPDQIKVHFVNEENNKTFSEVVPVHFVGGQSGIEISLSRLNFDENNRRSTGGAKAFPPVRRTGGRQISRSKPGGKRFRSTGNSGKNDDVTYSFEHYKNQTPPEELLTPLVDKDKNTIVEVFYATDRKKRKNKKGQTSFTNERGTISFGSCKVNVPKNKKKGAMPLPYWYHLEFIASDDDHMILKETNPLEPEGFFSQVETKVQSSPQKDAFLFIHGFNVSFRKSVLRTAQMAKDLNFNGAPIVYSWPSKNSILRYKADEATATGFSLDNMVHLLKDIKNTSGAQRIHLIAHSMGNKYLTDALKTLLSEGFHKDFQFNQVILASPDIDAQIFVKEIAPKISQCSQRVTLYASKYDFPLFFSGELHGIQRAGQSSEKIAVVEGVDTVDASSQTTGLLGHGYFAESKNLLDDIFHITRHNHAPEERNLKMRAANDKIYWEFE